MSELALPIPVAARYTRSVHLQRDFTNIRRTLSGYQVTPLVVLTLERIFSGLQPTSPARAFSIIGPYGSGKSAFGLFLAHYLRSDPSTRDRIIEIYI
jgi:reverse gyrase